MSTSMQLLLLTIALLTISTFSLTAQVTADTKTAARRDTIAAWLSRIEGGNPELPTLAVLTSGAQCSACNAAAINAFVKQTQTAGLRANVLVVIGAGSVREARPLLALLKDSRRVVAGADVVRALFDPSPAVPDAYVVRPDGGLAASFRNIQSEFPSLDSVAAAVRDARPAPAQAVPLQEDDDHVVLDVESPVLSPDGRRVTVLEPNRKAIETFDVLSGARVGSFSPPLELGMYFRKPTDDSSIWQRTIDVFAPLVSLQALVEGVDSDTLQAVGIFLRSYDTVRQANGRLRANWQRGAALVTIVGDRWLRVEPFMLKSYMPSPPFPMVHERLITYPLWTGFEPTDTAQRRDSLFAIARVDSDFALHPELPIGLIDSLYGRRMNALYAGRACEGADSSMFFLDGVNRVFLHAPGSDWLAARRVAPGGTLQIAFERYPFDTSGILQPAAMIFARDTLYVVVADRRESGAPRIVLQRYRGNGAYVDEREVARLAGPATEIRVAINAALRLAVLARSNGRWSVLGVDTK